VRLSIAVRFSARWLEHFDDLWRSPEEVEQVTGVPTLSLIPEYKESKTQLLG
jgi:capsular polysaccharide biosynthesis protein